MRMRSLSRFITKGWTHDILEISKRGRVGILSIRKVFARQPQEERCTVVSLTFFFWGCVLPLSSNGGVENGSAGSRNILKFFLQNRVDAVSDPTVRMEAS